jgi:hypothetical protein
MAQVQVDAPIWGESIVYAGKSPDSDINPWPAGMLSINGMANATAAVQAGGPGYAVTGYADCLSRNDLIFALRVINGVNGIPLGA